MYNVEPSAPLHYRLFLSSVGQAMHLPVRHNVLVENVRISICDEYQIRPIPREIVESFYVDEILMELRVETDEQSDDSEIACEGRTSETQSKIETEILKRRNSLKDWAEIYGEPVEKQRRNGTTW